jgi:hypothetical protein
VDGVTYRYWEGAGWRLETVPGWSWGYRWWPYFRSRTAAHMVKVGPVRLYRLVTV